jgi:hypothetical protein
MTWAKAMLIVLKIKDIDSKISDVEQVETYGRKVLAIKPKDLNAKDLAYFEDDALAPVATAIDKVVKQLDAVASAKFTMPEPQGTEDAFLKLCIAAADHGKGSKEAKAAAAKWGGLCSAFREELLKASVPLRAAKAELPRKIIAAQTVRDTASKVEGVMEICMKIPVPSGTAQNAQFFEMYQRCGEIMAGANRIESRLIAIQERNHDYLEEMRGILVQNDKWIAYASKASGLSKEELDKNRKAKVPR